MCYAGGIVKKSRVIVPLDISDAPSNEEAWVARVLAKYFKNNVEFVVRGLQKTADYVIDSKYWELKTIEGVGK